MMDDDAYDWSLSDLFNDADVKISRELAQIARPLRLAAIREHFARLLDIANEGVSEDSLTAYEANEILCAAEFYRTLSDELEE